MADLPTSFEDERRYYVHARLAPGQPISRQTDHDKLWIREPFLNSRFNFGKHVVHGHTPVDGGKPDVQRNRTNIDTGAVFGGALTAGVFTSVQRTATEFLQAFGTDADRRSRTDV
jgi:serine/threonine protein phosphatase 1